MDMDTQHILGNAVWTWTCNMNIIIDKEHTLVHAACPCPYCMSIFMLHVLVHAECPCPLCSTDLNMQHGHLHISMDMDMSMQHGHGHAAFHFYSLRIIFVSLYSLQIIFVSLLFASYHIRFACQIFEFASKRKEANLTL